MLFFIENNLKFLICRIDSSEGKDAFYKSVYHRIIRSAFYPTDHMGTLKDEETGFDILVLSYDTLPKSGLDKFKEYKDSIKAQILNK